MHFLADYTLASLPLNEEFMNVNQLNRIDRVRFMTCVRKVVAGLPRFSIPALGLGCRFYSDSGA